MMKNSAIKKTMKTTFTSSKTLKNRCEQATIQIKLVKIMQKTTLTNKHLMELEQL